MMAPAIKTSMQKEIKNYAIQGSPSANWYIQATELIPHPVTKNTPRKMAVIIHRLRLGYKATWQMLEGINRPCNYCDEEPESPLLHYLLDCLHTVTLRGNRIPNSQNPNSSSAAANL